MGGGRRCGLRPTGGWDGIAPWAHSAGRSYWLFSLGSFHASDPIKVWTDTKLNVPTDGKFRNT